MILKSKIEEACNRTCNEGVGLRVHNDSLKRSLFKAGVSFAEKELENLAIEFAISLISKPVTKRYSVDKCEEYIPKEFDLLKGELLLHGKELFEIFKQENYESNK